MSQTPDEIERLRQQLSQLDPAPFVELLMEGLLERPTREEWRRFAASSPDKYVKAMKQLSSVVGFTERIAVDHSHRHHVVLENMNDAELLAYVQEKRKAIPLLPVVEAEAEEVQGGPANIGPSEADLRDAGVLKKDA